MIESNDGLRPGFDIAVVGMACRFPGANDIDQFWHNLITGKETLTFFTDSQLQEAGVAGESLADPNYVKAAGILKDIDYFDAPFFDYTPIEAEILDPQVRLFHECAWGALEDAGCNPDPGDESIGVYAGATASAYWGAYSLLSENTGILGYFLASQLCNKDVMNTLTSYKLNLKGPSFAVQTACSTGLVAIHLACQGLINGECDIALAGGVTVSLPQEKGYFYQEGGLFSRDGHNRAFDAGACGTVFGSGCGVVVLKPIEEAMAGRDHIYAIIKGSAINNDGKRKVGFTAPSVEGQKEVIRAAQRVAEVAPTQINYIETHGTATVLGDTVEIDALKLAFNTAQTNFCVLGAVKNNIGHLDAAAGTAGFIKTVLVLKNRVIPPAIHFNRANPNIDFIASPFYINTELIELDKTEYPFPIWAGVSSFGIGGTNAHAVLMEAPPLQTQPSPPAENRDCLYPIFLSAKTNTALDAKAKQLVEYFQKHPGVALDDVGYTLLLGRKAFPYRRLLLCLTPAEAVEKLSAPGSDDDWQIQLTEKNPPVVFIFSGQETAGEDLRGELYRQSLLYKKEIDECWAAFTAVRGPQSPGPDRTITFIKEYALARLLVKSGIRPSAIMGSGFGELAAARDERAQLAHDYLRRLMADTGAAGNHQENIALLNEPRTIIIKLGPAEDEGNNRIIEMRPGPAQDGPGEAAFIKALALLYLYGVPVNWNTFYKERPGRRLPLPTYPFERRRFSIKKQDPDMIARASRALTGTPTHATHATHAAHAAPGPAQETGPGYYIPTWKRWHHPAPAYLPGGVSETGKRYRWLVFMDDRGLGAALAGQLAGDTGNGNVICVWAGAGFEKKDRYEYTIDPQKDDDYRRLFNDIQIQPQKTVKAIHLWSITGDETVPFQRRQELGLYSLLHMARSFAGSAVGNNAPMQIHVVTDNLQKITGYENVHPDKATILAGVKVIPQEYGNIGCTCTDIQLAEPGSGEETFLIQQLLKEFMNPAPDKVTAYRGAYRWVEDYQDYPLDKQWDAVQPLRNEGVYLITGGLGGIGLVLAEYLAQAVKARLILTSRGPFPPKGEWQDRLSRSGGAGDTDTANLNRKIRALLAIEKHGGSVTVMQADAADERQMQEAVQKTLAAYGTLHGVIHAAGIIGGESYKTIAQTEEKDFQVHFQPKVYGLQVLEKVLENENIPLDFCLLMSSMSSLLGGLGHVAYAAANLYMDAFIHYHNRRSLCSSTPWVSVNWETWHLDESRKKGLLVNPNLGKNENYITAAELTAAFPRILSWNRGSGGERIIFARGDLDLRINQWIRLTDVSPAAETAETAGAVEQVEEKAPNRDLHPRPELPVPYAAPADEIEASLAELWQEFFGIAAIGIDDDFFALGGDSLKAIIILERISKKLAARITVADFFDAPTIRGVAVHVRTTADGISQPAEQSPVNDAPDQNPVIPQAKIYREEDGDFEF